MTRNIIALLQDPLFLSCVLEDTDGQHVLQFSPDIHPSRREIAEAEHILRTLDGHPSAVSAEEVQQLKNRIQGLILGDNSTKNSRNTDFS
jgi:hypothetical protein